MKKLNFIKPKLIKPKILLSTPLALFSLEIYLGALSGYFFAKFLSGKQVGLPGKIKSLVFDIGHHKLHLHHWLYGLGILIFAISSNFFPIFSQFSYGFLGGFIFQGISSYPDWHKILIRKKHD